MNKNEKVWTKIFNDYDVVNTINKDGVFIINAKDIHKYGREPRLMTKFDHKVNLPKIFLDNNLSILPITRGEYIISSFDAYKKLEQPDGKIEHFYVPDYIQTLSQEFIVSEAIALNCANTAGIMADFLEDEEIEYTISGRMGSDRFSFDINTEFGVKNVDVLNSQIEIDASFEGINYFSIFEAKQDLADDFLVRQLYYPYRVWKNRITKPVKTVFFVYSNGIFNLYQYSFEDPLLYNSAKLVKFKRYSIASVIRLSEIEKLLSNTGIIEEKEIPFPQANSMPRIINLLELLSVKNMSETEITSEYDFDERQTKYYTDALRYLQLVEKFKDENSNISYRLTEQGISLMQLGLKDRQLRIAKLILMHKPFQDSLKLWLQTGQTPGYSTIEEIMKNSNLYNVEKESTYHRRASTVAAWIKWIIELIEE